MNKLAKEFEQLAKLRELEDRLDEIAEERGVELTDRENVKTVEMVRPVHGEARLHSETVEYEAPEPRTYTREVPLEGGDVEDPDTITKEYKDYGPTPEEVIEWSSPTSRSSKLNSASGAGDTDDTESDSDIPAPGEVYRERSDE